ncbi:hypothetical protein BGZ61DRAFT_352574 [Ilyonectria robusta]|uniref:uncharacterized protein n=1 Tax=Ilyonectria robusta TaxID=1079257 RepID=UPI001E8D2607|nr:uncharacterized protein BGZ61DRAFT_352574 [Ilyonectria robusta]KAH8694620.1 hypothetical protein BGZ61DRAFT_352574 [Ilyonectria robusta]
MVKIAIAGASSELAREVLDKLVATQKHEIIALVRKNSANFPTLPGVKWVETTYEDKSDLVQLFKGVNTVLCFITVHLDPESKTQKRIIDAAVEAGVKRYAPSEWSAGVEMESSVEVIPWYAGKVDINHYLGELNKNQKVLEYSRFQPGWFLNYLGHPHQVSKYITTVPLQFDLETLHAVLVEGSLDYQITYTSVADIANVVARAVEYTGEWPVVGGIRGHRVTVGELLEIGENIRGKPFVVDWLKMEDLQAGIVKTDRYARLDIPSIPKDHIEAFSKMATAGILIAMSKGVWTVSDEWNKIFPDYEFEQVDTFLKKLWPGE